MRPQILRLLSTLATFAVVWLVAGSARASVAFEAPICDPRGAITFAPPPQVQAEERSLDIVVNDDDCTRSPLETDHVVPHRAPPAAAAAPAQDVAAAAALVAVARAGADEKLSAPDAIATRARPGYRAFVERPPRA